MGDLYDAVIIRDLYQMIDKIRIQLDSALTALHFLVCPDNGKCNQCGGHWLYRRDQTWVYSDGEHTPSCKERFACLVSR
jgi:hypothetical protein